MSISQFFVSSRHSIPRSDNHSLLIPSQVQKHTHNSQSHKITPFTTQYYNSNILDWICPTSTISYNHFQAIGDKMPEEKTSKITRLYIQNINGIQIDSNGGELSTVTTEMSRMNADIIALIETNLDNTKYHIRQQIYDTLRKYNKHYKCKISGTSIPSATNYKPGGLISWSSGNVTGHIKSCNSNPLGRWIHWTMNSKDKTIHMIFIYQVCNDMSSTEKFNTMTAFAQQMSLLKQQKHKSTHPRHHFCSDLRNLLQTIKTHKNQEILVAGDFNEEFGVNQKGITKIALEFQLQDIRVSFRLGLGLRVRVRVRG